MRRRRIDIIGFIERKRAVCVILKMKTGLLFIRKIIRLQTLILKTGIVSQAFTTLLYR